MILISNRQFNYCILIAAHYKTLYMISVLLADMMMMEDVSSFEDFVFCFSL